MEANGNSPQTQPHYPTDPRLADAYRLRPEGNVPAPEAILPPRPPRMAWTQKDPRLTGTLDYGSTSTK